VRATRVWRLGPARLAVVALAIAGIVATATLTSADEATAGSAPTTVTLGVTDGYDLKNAKTLSADGKVGVVGTSNDDRLQVEAGYWISFSFQSTIPTGATIQSVRIGAEHHEETGIGTSAIQWQAATGTIQSPSGPSQTVTLQVTDGWDAKNAKTLLADGKVPIVRTSDGNRIDVEAGY
jgi:hypothetical protein